MGTRRGYRRRRRTRAGPHLPGPANLGVDVLLAGPVRTMDSTVTDLREVGVPDQRIRFDQYEAVTAG